MIINYSDVYTVQKAKTSSGPVSEQVKIFPYNSLTLSISILA